MGDILRESLQHERESRTLACKLLEQVEGKSIQIEYAREMICDEPRSSTSARWTRCSEAGGYREGGLIAPRDPAALMPADQ
jgi:hypothetical protein